jgi:hypothetical protein
MTQYVQERVATIERPVTAWALLCLIFGLVCVYAYFVNGAIVNAVLAKEMRTEISSLTSSIGALEAEYLAAKSSVSLESALASGFGASESDTIYIAKRGTTPLSFNR